MFFIKTRFKAIVESTSFMVNRPSFYGNKRAILGEVIAEVNAKGGGLRLSKDWSRALKASEIHEVMITRSELSPGDELKEFVAVAFFEVSQGGHSVIGDRLLREGKDVGILVGYEMNHMPNHMNIVFKAIDDMPLFKLGDKIKIQ